MKIQLITVPISNIPDKYLSGSAKYLQSAVHNVTQFKPTAVAELTKIKEDLQNVYFEMWKRAFQPVAAELKIRLAPLKK